VPRGILPSIEDRLARRRAGPPGRDREEPAPRREEVVA
jgi:hypothetical protein